VLLFEQREYEEHGRFTLLDRYTFKWGDGRMALPLGLGTCALLCSFPKRYTVPQARLCPTLGRVSYDRQDPTMLFACLLEGNKRTYQYQCDTDTDTRTSTTDNNNRRALQPLARAERHVHQAQGPPLHRVPHGPPDRRKRRAAHLLWACALVRARRRRLGGGRGDDRRPGPGAGAGGGARCMGGPARDGSWVRRWEMGRVVLRCVAGDAGYVRSERAGADWDATIPAVPRHTTVYTPFDGNRRACLTVLHSTRDMHILAALLGLK
jgi:hypothetical protein